MESVFREIIMPKISVIVPVYKVEKYLARCVDSILAQTFKDFELILVDDGSPDNCPAMCDEYAAKFNFIHVIHKENGGLSDARNKGIEYSLTTDSEWITFIDSDDWVHPQYLEILYESCVENEAEISSCCFDKIKDFESITNNYIKKEDLSFDFCEGKDFYCNYYNSKHSISIAPARLYSKNLWQEIRFPIERLHEDEFTIYKVVFCTKKIILINRNLYYYFQNSGSITSAITIKRLKDRFDALKSQVVFFNEHKQIRSYCIAFERLLRM